MHFSGYVRWLVTVCKILNVWKWCKIEQTFTAVRCNILLYVYLRCDGTLLNRTKPTAYFRIRYQFVLSRYKGSSKSFCTFFNYLLRTSKANYITFLYSHIQPSCNPFNCYSSVFTNQFEGSFFIPRGRGCNWTFEALCIHHTRAAIFEHFDPLIDDSTRENFIPILSTHADMNLCSRHTFCPQKPYDRTLFLFGAIYKFHGHLHHSVTTIILNSKVSRLARLTSHVTISDMTNYISFRPYHFPRKYKSAETFWRTLVHQQ